MIGMLLRYKKMPKFFFDAERFDGTHIEMTGETAHHIINVLRHNLGDEVLLCDGNCTDYTTRLISCDTYKKITKIKFEIKEVKKCMNEPHVFVRLCQSVIKWENFDFAVQKSVEVGVSEIVPIVTKRSIYRISDVRKKIERFNRIAKSAAEQSMRGIVPRVMEPVSIDAFILNAMTTTRDDIGFFASCEEKITLPRRLENLKFDKVDLFIGPEGGFSSEETKSLIANSMIPYSLGSRVLRSETAGIVSIAHIVLFSER